MVRILPVSLSRFFSYMVSITCHLLRRVFFIFMYHRIPNSENCDVGILYQMCVDSTSSIISVCVFFVEKNHIGYVLEYRVLFTQWSQLSAHSTELYFAASFRVGHPHEYRRFQSLLKYSWLSSGEPNLSHSHFTLNQWQLLKRHTQVLQFAVSWMATA